MASLTRALQAPSTQLARCKGSTLVFLPRGVPSLVRNAVGHGAPQMRVCPRLVAPTRDVATAAFLPNLPAITADTVAEGFMSLMLICLWGSVLVMSVHLLSVVSTAGNTAYAMRAHPAAAAIAPTAAMQIANPAALLLRAIAATVGVLLTGAFNAVGAVPATILHVMRLIIVTVAGSLLHMI